MSGGVPALALQGLTRRYGAIIGVEDLTMSVGPGEIHGFLGRNGAGKTTTLKCLMGFLRWDAGRAELFGHPFDPTDPLSRTHVGFSSELPVYPTHLTGREVLD
ncbi:MAG: ATP-binding cassette domain-containing protein, partial [Thermoplasmata archaeon]